jgi:hypothetical protein
MTEYYFLITFEDINHPRYDAEIKKVILKKYMKYVLNQI